MDLTVSSLRLFRCESKSLILSWFEEIEYDSEELSSSED